MRSLCVGLFRLGPGLLIRGWDWRWDWGRSRGRCRGSIRVHACGRLVQVHDLRARHTRQRDTQASLGGRVGMGVGISIGVRVGIGVGV